MQPRSIHEAATEYGMSIEGFAQTDEYRAGVADGSIAEWVRTGGTPESEAVAESTPEPDPAVE